MKLSDKITVSVCMITYNHENYIEEAINGVLMQNCDFQIELIIANDCSPDNTDRIVNEIIKYHPKGNLINYTNHASNIGMINNFLFALEKCSGKYIALCEGDDYWTDPYKLQMQVDFLEANPDYGMVHTNYNILKQDTGKIKKQELSNIPSGNIYEALLLQIIVRTVTVLFHNRFLKHFIDFYSETRHNWQTPDLLLFLIISSQSKVSYIDDITAIYRKHSNSITSFRSMNEHYDFMNSSYELRFKFINEIRSVNKKTSDELNRLFNKTLLYLAYLSNRDENIDNIFGELKKYGTTLPDYLRYYSFKNKFVHLLAKIIFKFFG